MITLAIGAKSQRVETYLSMIVIIGATIVAAVAPDTKSTPNLYGRFFVFHSRGSAIGSASSGLRVTVFGLSIFMGGLGDSMLCESSDFIKKMALTMNNRPMYMPLCKTNEWEIQNQLDSVSNIYEANNCLEEP